MIVLADLITDDEAEWYGDRITESATGRIIIADRLIKKFRKTHDNDLAANHLIRAAILESQWRRGFF